MLTENNNQLYARLFRDRWEGHAVYEVIRDVSPSHEKSSTQTVVIDLLFSRALYDPECVAISTNRTHGIP